MPPKHLLLGCVFVTVLAACADAFECTPQPNVITAKVIDPLANPVPIEAAWLLQDERRTECERESSSARNAITCKVSKPGPVKLVVAAQGAMLERDLEVELHRRGDDSCDLASLRESFVYDGPTCDLSKLIAVQGELYYDADHPAAGTSIPVEIRSSAGSARCTVEGNRFTCPPTSFYATEYTVTAVLAGSRLERSTTVAIGDCEIQEPTELRIDRSERVCESDDRGTISVSLEEPAPGQPGVSLHVLPDGVRANDGKGWSDCELAPEGRVPGPRPFVCQATTQTGGGVYVLEIMRGARSEKLAVRIPDNGCQISASISVRFELDRFCERECGPAGELLNSIHACSAVIPDTTGLPSCPAALK